MSKDTTAKQARPLWSINLGWYQQNNRSLAILAQSCLCPKCRKKLGKETSPAELMITIKDCCSKTQDFINGKQPILESMFRLFLANGNQPLGFEELRKRLSELRAGDTYHTSAEIFSRMLKDEQYYGLRRVQE
jgi:hypothetical protein